jgi:hypothetical protein
MDSMYSHAVQLTFPFILHLTAVTEFLHLPEKKLLHSWHPVNEQKNFKIFSTQTRMKDSHN